MAYLYLFPALLLLGQALAAMGPGPWSMGPTKKGVTVEEAHATLTLPETPNSPNGDAILWFGLGTDGKDLYQALAFNGPPYPQCIGKLWCAQAFVLHGPNHVTGGPILPQPPGTRMTWHYQRQGDNMVTSVEIGGKIVSSVTTPYNDPIGAGTATECHTNPPGLIAAHVWSDISVKLSARDPSIKKTHPGGCFNTKDGGQTWTCDTWRVKAYDCNRL